MAEIKYEIVESIFSLEEGGNMHIELNRIKWNNRAPVYDLRKWNDDHSRMGKGLTMTEAEINALAYELNNLINSEED